jgi:xanthine/uracil permease
MAPIAIASMMEHIGDMSAISATVGENFIEDPGLHRTLIGDGIATSMSAMFGGPANTTYGENTGVLVLSNVHDPKVVRLAALFAIVLGFIPKMAEVIGSMPSAIVGGVSFILYGMISAIGVRNIVENKVDFTNSRNLIIAAVILVCGLGFSGGLTFTVAGTPITLTKKEFDLLKYLMEHKGQAVTRDALLTDVWGYDYAGDTNVVDVYIRYLRHKIDEPFGVKTIHTIRAVGYMFSYE